MADSFGGQAVALRRYLRQLSAVVRAKCLRIDNFELNDDVRSLRALVFQQQDGVAYSVFVSDFLAGSDALSVVLERGCHRPKDFVAPLSNFEEDSSFRISGTHLKGAMAKKGYYDHPFKLSH